MQLQQQIETLATQTGKDYSPADRQLFSEFKNALNRGEVRAAERNSSGDWLVNSWVKQGILLGFRMGVLTDMSTGSALRFFDKDTYPTRPTQIIENVRIVPG